MKTEVTRMDLETAKRAVALERAKTEQMFKRVAQKVMEAKALWLDRTMLEILPTEVYQWGRCGTPDQQRKASQWLEENGYFYVENPTEIRLMRKQEGKETQMVTAFRFQFDAQKPIDASKPK